VGFDQAVHVGRWFGRRRHRPTDDFAEFHVRIRHVAAGRQQESAVDELAKVLNGNPRSKLFVS